MLHYDLAWVCEQYDQGTPLDYVFFWGHTQSRHAPVGKTCLSQWYVSPFEVEGIRYPTAEHWMMAQKALLFGDTLIHQQIIASPRPADVKQLGRQVANYEEAKWRTHRFEIVKHGNWHKFTQNTALGDFLCATAPKIIVEASPKDRIWGIGLHETTPNIHNPHTWRGTNLLGFVLMEVRDALLSAEH